MVRSRRRENTNAKRFEIFCDLRAAYDGKKLRHGVIGDIADKHNVSPKTVQRYWRLGNGVSEPEDAWRNLKSKKKGNSGRPKLDREALILALKAVPIRQRRTYRHAAKAIGYSTGAIFNAVRRGDLKRMSCGLRPALTAANKLQRLQFCLSFIDPVTRKFDGMYNRIHVDEKWFYMKEGKLTAIVTPDEDMPNRNTKSKRYITKVMLIAAVARPRFSADGEVEFDGKIGFWAFTEEVAAKKDSKHRKKGTMEMKPVNVDSTEYRKMMVDNVIPSVKSRWPKRRPGPIYIQQDNAPAHVAETDMEVVLEGNRYSWEIDLHNQPPNSPDYNVLDLGIFRALQSTTWDTDITNIRDTDSTAKNAFKKLTPHSLNNTFLSLQQHMESSMMVDGGNNYKEPHMKKDKRRRAGENIEVFTCSQEAYDIATAKLQQSE